MKKITPQVLLIAALALLSGAAEAGNAAAPGAADFMWWRAAGSERTPDGGMTVDYELHAPRGVKVSDAEIFVISSVRRGTPSARAYGAPDVFRKPASVDSSPLRVTVYSGRAERVDLRAMARSGDMTYYAGTAALCYGESGKTDPDAERVSAAPEWPGFSLEMGERFYRAQTGSPVTVKCDPAPSYAGVFENGNAAATSSGAGGTFSYVPPHDKALSELGYRAKKDLVFAAVLPDGRGIASFYVPVYRAYYGQTSVKGGVAVMSGSALASLIFAGARGRRFRWR